MLRRSVTNGCGGHTRPPSIVLQQTPRSVSRSSGHNPNYRTSRASDEIAFDQLLNDSAAMKKIRGKLLSGMAAAQGAGEDSSATQQPARVSLASVAAQPSSARGGRGGRGMQEGRLGAGGRDRGRTGARPGGGSGGRPEGRPGSRPGGRTEGRMGGRGGGRTHGRMGGRGDRLSRPQRSYSGSDEEFKFPNVDAPVAVLHAGKDWLFRNGSPMVYGGAIQHVLAPDGRPADLAAGDPVMVCDHIGQLLGWGVFNPVSMFRVRLMQMRQEYEEDNSCMMDMPALIRKRIKQARALRQRLDLPRSDTDIYRLINSEGDRLSGLVVDILGNVAVVQSVAAWAERYRSVVEATLTEELGLNKIVWKPSADILKEEGITLAPKAQSAQPAVSASTDSDTADQEAEAARNGTSGSSSSSSSSSNNSGIPAETYVGQEAGTRYLTAPAGQKTGFYADQRDSRAFLAQMCKGAHVLDLCCYSGAFSLAAARAGAARVTGVDSSPEAIALADENAKLNGVEDKVTFFKNDISKFMRAEVSEQRKYDIVILDPPKLAPSRANLERATLKYQALNSQAMKLVAPGGILMTCSCSGAMTQSGNFSQVVEEAARVVGRHITLLRHAGAAPDHPQHPGYPEGKYLTNLCYLVA